MFGFLEWWHKKRLLLNRLLLWRGVDVFFKSWYPWTSPAFTSLPSYTFTLWNDSFHFIKSNKTFAKTDNACLWSNSLMMCVRSWQSASKERNIYILCMLGVLQACQGQLWDTDTYTYFPFVVFVFLTRQSLDSSLSQLVFKWPRFLPCSALGFLKMKYSCVTSAKK